MQRDEDCQGEEADKQESRQQHAAAVRRHTYENGSHPPGVGPPYGRRSKESV